MSNDTLLACGTLSIDLLANELSWNSRRRGVERFCSGCLYVAPMTRQGLAGNGYVSEVYMCLQVTVSASSQ